MNKRLGLLIVAIFILTSFKSKTNSNPVATTKYAGRYSFGDNVEKGTVGSFTAYPETDSTILFFLDICKGAPSYNLGQLFDRLVIRSDSALYFSKEDYDEKGCKLRLHFKGDKLTIKTVVGFYECPFGGGVYADNTNYRKDKNIPKYFINGEGDTIIFNIMTPEKYLHRNDIEK